MKKKSEFKPLLYTTTVRNPKRMKSLLNILSNFNGQMLSDELAEKVMGELIRFGLYRPVNKIESVKTKWSDTKLGEISKKLLSDSEVDNMLENNPQDHKEAGFDKGWSSRFATIFDFAKELGFVYFWQNEVIEFSKIGLMLANSVEINVDDEKYILFADTHPEFEQQAFLHALAKSQRNNPFVRVLNENIPLILLLEVIQKLNNDKELNNVGISKLELPFVIFWKDNNSQALYELIKRVRKTYGAIPSWEVIVDICRREIMGGTFKEFDHKSIISDYPDEFIRKMRLTGLISLRGAGRYIDINKNEQEKVDYILKTYSKYQKFETEREYFDYMAKTDENLILVTTKKVTIEENNKFLDKWIETYKWTQIRDELTILSKKGLSKDEILKYLSNPIRLEFLTSLAIKSKFPNIKVKPNYPCDDEGIPTSTAGGMGNQGDIECYEDDNGILIEVTMIEGRSQTIAEGGPIVRHLQEFHKKNKSAMCYFVAPSIYSDTSDYYDFCGKKHNLIISTKTIDNFLHHLETEKSLYCYS